MGELARPEGQRVVSWIAGALALIGEHPGERRIKRELTAGSRALIRTRNVLLKPVRPIVDAAELSQQWSLFTLGTPIAFRIHIEVQHHAGDWIPVYRTHHEDRLGLSRWLHYRRLRGMYNPSASRGPRGQYEHFVRWLAREVLRSHPELAALRVSMERIELATRSQPSRVVGLDHVREHAREPLP
jgi:hypothetical protein